VIDEEVRFESPTRRWRRFSVIPLCVAVLGGSIWLLVLASDDTKRLLLTSAFAAAMVGFTAWSVYKSWEPDYAAISPNGLTVRFIRGTCRIPWSGIESIKLVPYPDVGGKRQSFLDFMLRRGERIGFAQLTLRKRPSIALALIGRNPLASLTGPFGRTAMIDVLEPERFVEVAQAYLQGRN
jgi:hypothetical protein